MHCVFNHLYVTIHVNNSYKIVSYPDTLTLLHVQAINRYPQGGVNRTKYVLIHMFYIYYNIQYNPDQL